MKVNMCDACLAAKRLTVSTIRSGYPNGIKLHLCNEHKDWNRGKPRADFEKEALELQITGLEFVNSHYARRKAQ